MSNPCEDKPQSQSDPKFLAEPKTSGMAIGSMIAGLLSLLTCLTALPGIIMGVIALNNIGNPQNNQTGRGFALTGIISSIMGMTFIPILAILVALLLPAINAARTAARRNQTMHQMRQVQMGCLNQEMATKRFPPQKYPEAELSWRVNILRMVEQQQLFDQFDKSADWNSPENSQLSDTPLSIYQSPFQTSSDNHTVYLGVTGPGTMFDPDQPKGVNFRQVSDGASNTAMIVSADETLATPWAKPQDWKLDESRPLHDLGNLIPGNVFLVTFVDGHSQTISKNIDPQVWKALCTRHGGETIDMQAIDR
jgi:hypothetical protein